jgi:hypothetical protein
MGSRGDSGGGSGGNTGADAGFFVSEQRKKEKKQAQINEKDDTQAKMDLFYERGATDIKNKASKVPSPALAILSGPLQAGSRKNREFFTDKVLGSKNYKETTKDSFQNLSATQQESMYQDYMSGRQSGKTDAYGNQIGTGRDDSTMAARTKRKSIKSVEQPKAASQMDNTGVKSKMISADQTAPTDVEMTDDEYSVATKKRGRKRTVLTSATGDTTKATLSKKTLLGG